MASVPRPQVSRREGQWAGLQPRDRSPRELRRPSADREDARAAPRPCSQASLPQRCYCSPVFADGSRHIDTAVRHETTGSFYSLGGDDGGSCFCRSGRSVLFAGGAQRPKERDFVSTAASAHRRGGFTPFRCGLSVNSSGNRFRDFIRSPSVSVGSDCAKETPHVTMNSTPALRAIIVLVAPERDRRQFLRDCLVSPQLPEGGASFSLRGTSVPQLPAVPTKPEGISVPSQQIVASLAA